MTSIEDLVGQVFGNNSSSTNIINSETSDSGGNGKGNRRSKNRNKRSEKEQDQVNARHKRPYTVYKYSNKLKGPVYEAVILAGQAAFLFHENGQIKAIDQIEELSRVILPPCSVPMQDKPEDPEGSEGSVKTPHDSHERNNKENEETTDKSSENIQDINTNNVNILQENSTKNSSTSLEPSVLSVPSVITQSNIYRLGHTDRFACKNCSIVDDKWFMQKHLCKGRSSK
jgi:hypothetical protein